MHDPGLTPLRWTFSWPVIRNSLIVGAVVGTILNMINQGEHIAGDGPINRFKLGLARISHERSVLSLRGG